MTQDAAQKPVRPNVRLAIGLLVGFAIGLAAGSFASRIWRDGADVIAVQKGIVNTATGVGEYDFWLFRFFSG